jgi:hypothetical protein
MTAAGEEFGIRCIAVRERALALIGGAVHRRSG